MSPRSSELVRLKAKRASEKARRFLLEKGRREELLAQYGVSHSMEGDDSDEDDEEEEEEEEEELKAHSDSSVEDVQILTSTTWQVGRGGPARRVAVRGKRLAVSSPAGGSGLPRRVASPLPRAHTRRGDSPRPLASREREERAAGAPTAAAAAALRAARWETVSWREKGREALLHRFGSVDKIPAHLLHKLTMESDSDDMFGEDEEDDDDDDDEDDDEDEEDMLMRLHGEELDETGSDVGSEYNYDTLKDALGLSAEQVSRNKGQAGNIEPYLQKKVFQELSEFAEFR